MQPRRLIPSIASATAALLALAALASVAFASSGAAAYEHVQNNSFEDGTVPWVARDETQMDIVDATVVSPAHGENSARLQAGAAGFHISQRLPQMLAAGAYRVSLMARAVGGGASIDLSIASDRDGAITGAAGIVEPVDGWTRMSGDVVIGVPTAATLTITGVHAPGAAIYVDDVRLTGAAPVTATATSTATAAMDPSPPPGQQAAATASPRATMVLAPTAAPIVDVIGRELRNAGFEDVDDAGGIVAWRAYGGELRSITSPVHGGSRAARLESRTAATKWLYQIVAVDGGGTYAFGAWIAHNDANVAATYLRISWYASDDGSGEAIAVSDSLERLESAYADYRYVTTEAVTAPIDARSARVRVLLDPLSAAPASITVDETRFGPASPQETRAAIAASRVETEASTVRESRGDVRAAPRGQSRAPRQVERVSGPLNGDVLISEVLYDSAGDGDDAGGEWVELYNRGGAAVDVGGWQVADGAASDELPSLVIAPGGFAVVAASGAFAARYTEVQGVIATLEQRIGNGLGNDGDQLSLIDPSGRLVDSLSWGTNGDALDPAAPDVPAGHSLERREPGVDTDAASDFVDNESPSPGRAYEPTRASRGSIAGSVEVLGAPARRDLDWVAWALTAASVAALAGAVGWRALSPGGRHE